MVLFIITNCIYSQDSIRLNLVHKGPFSTYNFINQSDSAFVKIGHENGIPDSPFFELKPGLKDNNYLVFVNDSLALVDEVKSHKKHGTWLRYNSGKIVKRQHFKNDTIWSEQTFHPNGLLKSNFKLYPKYNEVNFKSFYPSGSLKQSSKTNGGTNYVRHQYYENGKIKSREIINSGSVCIQNLFDQTAKLTTTKIITPYLNKTKEYQNNSDNDSLISYHFKNGKFNLQYSKGNLKQWKFIPTGNAIEVSEYVMHYSRNKLSDMIKESRLVKDEDVNFDGYKDKIIIPKLGSGANQPFSIFLYNPISQSFEYSKTLSGSSLSDNGPDLDSEKKTATYTGSSGGGIYGMEIIYFNSYGQIKFSDLYHNEELGNYTYRNGINHGSYSFNYKRIQDIEIIDEHQFITDLPLNGNESIYIPFFDWVALQIDANNR